jgi:hypothetical protein
LSKKSKNRRKNSGVRLILRRFKLVLLGEGRHGDVQNPQFSHGAMHAAWQNHHGCERTERDALAVGLQVAFAFQDDIDLRGLPVVMRAAGLRDVDQVDGGDYVAWYPKAAPGLATGTGNRRDLVQLGNSHSLHARCRE